MRCSKGWLAVVAAVVAVASATSPADACHRRGCRGGRMACAGGYGGGGGGCGGYAGGGYAGGGYAGGGYAGGGYAGGGYGGGYAGMASYPSPQYGGAMVSYPSPQYGGVVGSPQVTGMPATGGYSAAYGTMPATYATTPNMTAATPGLSAPMPGQMGAPGVSPIPPAPVVSGGVIAPGTPGSVPPPPAVAPR